MTDRKAVRELKNANDENALVLKELQQAMEEVQQSLLSIAVINRVMRDCLSEALQQMAFYNRDIVVKWAESSRENSTKLRALLEQTRLNPRDADFLNEQKIYLKGIYENRQEGIENLAEAHETIAGLLDRSIANAT